MQDFGHALTFDVDGTSDEALQEIRSALERWESMLWRFQPTPVSVSPHQQTSRKGEERGRGRGRKRREKERVGGGAKEDEKRKEPI